MPFCARVRKLSGEVWADLSASTNAYPLWVASGAALLGTAMGGAVVYVALSGRSPSPPAVPSSSDAVQSSALGRPMEPLVQAVAATRDTVVGIKIGGQFVGAGVVLVEDGTVLTNSHVIEPVLHHRAGLTARESSPDKHPSPLIVRFFDGRERRADLHWADAAQDVALLKIVPDRSGEQFAAATLGSSAQLKVGESVFVVGSPVGLEHSVSAGIVAALDRTSVLSNRATTAIQIDANINFGNSGGPLFNLDGLLVGITTTRSRKGDGIGFAIPIDQFLTLIRHSDNRRRWSQLGVRFNSKKQVQPYIESLGYRTGLWVESISQASKDADPSSQGLRAGDIVVALRGKRFDELGSRGMSRYRISWAIFAAVKPLVPGDTISITVVRDGKTQELSVPVVATSTEQQVIWGARWVLGMKVKVQDGVPFLESFTPNAPARRFFPRENLQRILGAKIVKMQGRDIRDLQKFGAMLFDLENPEQEDARRWVSLEFEDKDKVSWVVHNYPLVNG